MIASSQEEIQRRIWLVKSNQTDVTVQLQVLLCWSFLIGCCCAGQWRFDTVMISDEVGVFIILRNYLVGTQFYSLSLQTKSAVFFLKRQKLCSTFY
jgi:hypothetical protein